MKVILRTLLAHDSFVCIWLRLECVRDRELSGLHRNSNIPMVRFWVRVRVGVRAMKEVVPAGTGPI